MAIIFKGRSSHFFSSIVSVHNDGEFNEYLIIDGQQRLTTISLLMLAMYNLMKAEIIKPAQSNLADKIYKTYLIDEWQDEDTRIKLKPVKNDSKASVYLNLAKSHRDINKSADDFLYNCKDEIETRLGVTLNWWRFEGKASYVDYTIEGVGIGDETSWTQMAKFHAEWSKKIYDVLVPLLQQWNAVG